MTKLNFLYAPEQLGTIAQQIIDKALQAGATAAQVELNECISNSIAVLNQQIENFSTSHEHQLSLTVYNGKQKGNLGISQIDAHNLDKVIQQALDIAKYTEEDMANGLLEPQFMVQNRHSDLELYHEAPSDNRELIEVSLDLEHLSCKQNKQIISSDGAELSLSRYNFVIANSNGLNSGYQTSRYSKSVSLIATTAQGMQTDYWYSSARAYTDLASNQIIADTALQRTLRRMNGGKANSGKPAIIFESQVAKSLIGNLVAALSGGNLYRRLSFLNDSMGKAILPTWFNLSDDPYLSRGLASCYFDNEGSRVSQRNIIKDGVVHGYFLSSYSARKLALDPTGNAGGSHNLKVSPNSTHDLAGLAATIHNGIIIIDTIGHGLNLVSGDYSVGANGLVVENGIISHFADNLTIAGKLQDIFANIALIGIDSDPGHIECGAMVINSGIISVSTN